jgi:GDP-D-mannose 3', 5'-epimerase
MAGKTKLIVISITRREREMKIKLVTINQLADIVEEIAGIKLERNYNLNAPKGVNGRNSDNTKIKQYLGWEPSIRLKDGLSKTYTWIEREMLAMVGR